MANDIKLIRYKEELNISKLKKGEIHRFYLHMSENALGDAWKTPVIVIRGRGKGPTLGITAAVHGNELNGISTIFKLIEQTSPETLKGTLILVPISNVPGYLMNQRCFSDNVDLNRIMPGRPDRTPSGIYAYNFCHKLVSKFDYLLDLHTASHGRVNSLYIRADLENEKCRTLAYLQNPQIIVKKDDESGTLRDWANSNGVPSITIEIGNPNAFQHTLIDETLDGIKNTLAHLQMIEGPVKDMIENATVCDHSYWIYTSRGGIIDVLPKLTDTVQKGEVIANLYNVFGEIKSVITADRKGIVIGKNIRPNCEAGSRILHLGIAPIEPLPESIPGNDSYVDH